MKPDHSAHAGTYWHYMKAEMSRYLPNAQYSQIEIVVSHAFGVDNAEKSVSLTSEHALQGNAQDGFQKLSPEQLEAELHLWTPNNLVQFFTNYLIHEAKRNGVDEGVFLIIAGEIKNQVLSPLLSVVESAKFKLKSPTLSLAAISPDESLSRFDQNFHTIKDNLALFQSDACWVTYDSSMPALIVMPKSALNSAPPSWQEVMVRMEKLLDDKNYSEIPDYLAQKFGLGTVFDDDEKSLNEKKLKEEIYYWTPEHLTAFLTAYLKKRSHEKGFNENSGRLINDIAKLVYMPCLAHIQAAHIKVGDHAYHDGLDLKTREMQFFSECQRAITPQLLENDRQQVRIKWEPAVPYFALGMVMGVALTALIILCVPPVALALAAFGVAASMAVPLLLLAGAAMGLVFFASKMVFDLVRDHIQVRQSRKMNGSAPFPGTSLSVAVSLGFNPAAMAPPSSGASYLSSVSSASNLWAPQQSTGSHNNASDVLAPMRVGSTPPTKKTQ